jgi:hypothetical protein
LVRRSVMVAITKTFPRYFFYVFAIEAA